MSLCIDKDDPYMDRVGLYLDRCAVIWAYVPLFERLAIVLTGWTLIWTGWAHIWPGGLLSGHMGLYMDREI